MRYTIILIIFIFFKLTIYAQKAHRIENGLDLFSINQPIESLDSSIKCAEDKTIPFRYHSKDTSQPCLEYYYASAVSDTILISDIRFPYLSLSFNEKGRLIVVVYMKTYLVTGSTDSLKVILGDFSRLFSFLNSRFHHKGILNKSNSRSDDYSITKEYEWYQKSIVYRLSITQFSKRQDQKSLYLIQLYFRNRKLKSDRLNFYKPA